MSYKYEHSVIIHSELTRHKSLKHMFYTLLAQKIKNKRNLVHNLKKSEMEK